VLFKGSSGTDEIVVDLSTLRRPTVAPALAVAMAGVGAPGTAEDAPQDTATAMAVAAVLMEWGAVWGGEWAGETNVAVAISDPPAATGNELASVEVDTSATTLAPEADLVDVPRLESEVQAAADHVRTLKAATPIDSEAVADGVNKLLDLKDQLAVATQPRDSNSEEDSEESDDDDAVSQLATPEEWLEFPIYRLPEQATRWRLPRQGAKELAKALAAHWGTASDTAGGGGGGKTKVNKKGGSMKRGMPQIKPGKSRRSGGYGIG